MERIESKVIISRDGQHTLAGLPVQRLLKGSVPGTVEKFKSRNLSAPALFSPPVFFCIFCPSWTRGPGMGSCKDLSAGKPSVGNGGC